MIMICRYAITEHWLDQVCGNQKLQSELGQQAGLVCCSVKVAANKKLRIYLRSHSEAARRSRCLETGTKREHEGEGGGGARPVV